MIWIAPGIARWLVSRGLLLYWEERKIKWFKKKIEEENATNKDIIQIDMIDVYRNLPIKIAGLLNWLYQNCANFKGFILKVDDDIYVSVRTLEYYIHTHDPFSPRIFGNKNMNPYPVRGNNNF